MFFSSNLCIALCDLCGKVWHLGYRISTFSEISKGLLLNLFSSFPPRVITDCSGLNLEYEMLKIILSFKLYPVQSVAFRSVLMSGHFLLHRKGWPTLTIHQVPNHRTFYIILPQSNESGWAKKVTLGVRNHINIAIPKLQDRYIVNLSFHNVFGCISYANLYHFCIVCYEKFEDGNGMRLHEEYNSSTDSENSEMRHTISDSIIFRYCLGNLTEKSLLLKEITDNSSDDKVLKFANQVSLYSGCSHHR